MPLDILRRLITPLRDPVATSRYPEAEPFLQAATRGLPEIDPARCENTGACVEVCPTDAIELLPVAAPDGEPGEGARARDKPSIDAGKCVYCAACVLACPNGAIKMSSRVELASSNRIDLIQLPTADGEPAIDRAAEERARAQILGRFGRSLHVRHLDAGSCNGCDWEVAALLNSYHDVQRLGIDFVASPRHADLLLVTGVMTANLQEAAGRTYEAMPEPRLVVAIGACAISGGVFAGSPQTRNGVAGAFPVDVFVPGCPPRPEAIIEGLLMAVALPPRTADDVMTVPEPEEG
jgi:Ni,Fe-hydrogenase III small subunit/formate hydrogenlyase subunit 6/NADH:ubiquinone oxidoreductase subunit I